MCKMKLRLKRTPRQQQPEPRRNVEALNDATVRAAFKEQVERGLSMPAKSGNLNDKVG